MRRILLLLLAAAATGACGQPQRVGDNVLYACARPTPDTTGWRRIPGPYPGSTLLAPPGLEVTSRAGSRDVLLEDERRTVRVFRRVWGDAQFHSANASRRDYSSCWTRVGGMRTYVVVRRVDGGYQVTGWYRRPGWLPAAAGPLDGVVSGASAGEADQAVLLRMVHSLAPPPR